ncbi:glycosyltransferase [Roseomonas sp. E05]|uniref:glycosyltransferase n=1 Tax=Roseomonas sp. E05 TaxID=3046310 RepID=UPI0024BBB0CD|nr:glycosyltransferase [Roseomonas sp. E05]MDJ0388349.1 glycosyltransferase [Roseomonas sp. E05]
MDSAEEAMWWYRALRNRIEATLRARPMPAGPWLDVGCGTGGLLRHLATAFPGQALHGLEYNPRAAQRAAAKSGAAVAAGDAAALPFPDSCFAAVTALDVLCHAAVDQPRALAEMRRVLQPGGLLVLNLPALRWLHSAHDRRVHNARRYTTREAQEMLAQAGFTPIQVGYWNSLLLPLMVAQRKLLARGEDAASDVAPFPPWLDALLFRATEAEAALAHRGMAFPAGGSVLAVAARTWPEAASPAPQRAPRMTFLSPTEPAPSVGLSIVVPVYRGADTVGHLVEALSALKPAGGIEIVLVNDGSPDNSGDVCRALAASATVPLTYVEHARNFGEHNAVMTGLRHVRGRYVITMDDDLQNPPEEVVRLYDHARLGGWDVVYTRYAEKKHAVWRNLGSRFANWVADQLMDKPKGLYLCSFRCMSALVAQEVARYSGPYPYVDGLIMQVTQRIDSIEVKHFARVQGRSNYTLRRLIRLWLNLATNFSLLPLRMAMFAGVGMGLLGMVGAVFTIIEALTKDTPSGWASMMTVMLLLAGVQFLILGVLGEYVGRAFLSANGKPQGVVREVVATRAARGEAIMHEAQPQQAPGA